METIVDNDEHQQIEYVNLDQVQQPETTRTEMKLLRSAGMYSQDLFETLTSCFQEDLFADVMLYCRKESQSLIQEENGSHQWIALKANRSVLAAVSPYMKRILSCASLVEYCIVMDGFSYEEVTSLVQFAYMGQVDQRLQETVNIQRLVEIFELKFSNDAASSDMEEDGSEDVEEEEWMKSKEPNNEAPSSAPFKVKVTPTKRQAGLESEKSCDANPPADRTCDFCGKYFARPALMLNHRRIHTGEKPFVCTICNKNYREKSHLTRHQRSHSDNAKPFRCEVCDKSFANNFYLTQHTLTHSGYKRLLCSTCGYQCFQASDLKKHMRTHTGEKPYVCPVEFCGKAFTQKVSCIKHQQALHKNVDVHLESFPTFETEMLQ